MAMGMSYNDFWFGCPSMTKDYYNAHNYKRRQKNEEMWMQGVYFFDAVSQALAAFGYGLGGGKGTKPKGYMQKPLDIGLKTKEEKEAEAKAEREKAIASLNAWKAAWENKNGRGNS